MNNKEEYEKNPKICFKCNNKIEFTQAYDFIGDGKYKHNSLEDCNKNNKEQTFEEQFPELKDKDKTFIEYAENGRVYIDDIKEFCLSKQKIKEVIEKLIFKNVPVDCNHFCLNCQKEETCGGENSCFNKNHIVLDHYDYEQDDFIGATKAVKFLLKELNLEDK